MGMRDTGFVYHNLRVLVMVDDAGLIALVDSALSHDDLVTRVETTVSAGQSAIDTWQPHLLIVDADADDGRALQLIRAARRNRRLAVIALARRKNLRTMRDAVELGADLIVPLPFEADELTAYVRALMRSVEPSIAATVRAGELKIDLLNRTVTSDGAPLHLTSVEQALLYVLASNCGDIVSHGTLLDAVWGSDFVTETNVIERHVRALRSKLQDDWRRPRFIQTVRGRGYRFLAHLDRAAMLSVQAITTALIALAPVLDLID
jgi:DNA-binding response OmpR family regulator